MFDYLLVKKNMELPIEINQHIKDLFEKDFDTHPDKEKIMLLMNMAFSDGKSKGGNSANIISKCMGRTWSNRN